MKIKTTETEIDPLANFKLAAGYLGGVGVVGGLNNLDPIAFDLIQGYNLSIPDALGLFRKWRTKHGSPWTEAQLVDKLLLADRAPSPKPRGYLLPKSSSPHNLTPTRNHYPFPNAPRPQSRTGGESVPASPEIIPPSSPRASENTPPNPKLIAPPMHPSHHPTHGGESVPARRGATSSTCCSNLGPVQVPSDKLALGIDDGQFETTRADTPLPHSSLYTPDSAMNISPPPLLPSLPLSSVSSAKEDSVKSSPPHSCNSALCTPNSALTSPLSVTSVDSCSNPSSPPPPVTPGAALLTEIAATLSLYVTAPEPALVAASLFVLHTYAFNFGDLSPILFITGPARRCGKSKFLAILSRLVANRFPGASVSPRALYRAIELEQPTLCLDDVDAFVRNKDQLRALLNSCNREDAFHLGCSRERLGHPIELLRWTTWTPKIFSGMGRTADAVKDSAIVIEMARCTNDSSRKTLHPRLRFEQLRARAAQFIKDHEQSIRAANSNPQFPDGVENLDQAAIHWIPLLAIADCAGGDWPEKARGAALILSGGPGTAPSGDVGALVADIRQVFLDQQVKKMSSLDLANHLADLEGRPWSEVGKPARPMTPNQLANLLRHHGICSHTIRLGDQTPRGYVLSDFKDAYHRHQAQNSTTKCNTATSPVNTCSEDASQRSRVDENARLEGATNPSSCASDDTVWSDDAPEASDSSCRAVIPKERLAILHRIGQAILTRTPIPDDDPIVTAYERESTNAQIAQLIESGTDDDDCKQD